MVKRGCVPFVEGKWAKKCLNKYLSGFGQSKVKPIWAGTNRARVFWAFARFPVPVVLKALEQEYEVKDIHSSNRSSGGKTNFGNTWPRTELAGRKLATFLFQLKCRWPGL